MLLLPNKSELRSPVALSLSLSLTLYGFMCHTSRSAKSKSCLSGATQNNKLRFYFLHSLICTVCVYVIQIFLISISATHTKYPTILYFNCACVYLHNQTVGKYQRTKRKWRFYLKICEY